MDKPLDNPVFQNITPEAAAYIQTLERRLADQQAQIERLTELIRLANKARFGSSSEKLRYIMDDQVSLFNEAEACADESAPEPVIVEKHTRKPKRTKEQLAKEMPVKEVIIELPENERVCVICEGELKPIGKTLVRRELEIIPAQTYITEIYQVSYGCDDCVKESDEANIVKAPVPVPIIKRGLASPSSAAHVFYQKYVNAMPLYRQEQDWANFGVEICRATLANWIIYIALTWLTPLWEQMKTRLITAEVILADETVVQVLKEPGKTPQSESRMWVYCTGTGCGPPIILFEYQPTRAGEHPKKFLEGAKPGFYLHTDGYAGYNSVKNAVHCGCWAHLRRKFNDALPKTEQKGSKALDGLTFCQKLFKPEEGWVDLSPDDRLEQRQQHSKPVLDEFFAWLETVNALSGSKLAEAVTYARNQREPLSAFLLDGRIDISTNKVENAIRPFAVGRKNFLFADTVKGAKASAIAYSIIETARANGLNPYQYLLYLFTKLPSVLTKNPEADLSGFFPWAIAVRDSCRLDLNRNSLSKI
jgi:transposase